MINRVILVGRITKDPELRTTQSDLSVCSFTLAVNRQFKSKEGENEADFIQCVVWRKQAENLVKYIKRGNMIGVDGRVQTRTYDNNEGVRQYVTEIVCDSIQFLETNKQDSQPHTKDNSQQGGQVRNIDISDDNLPF